MYDVAVFGSCMIDFISYVSRMPKPGETLHSTSFETGFGGKGANQCIAAARLGCKAAMIGKVGNDPYGIKYKSHFEAEGVATDFLQVAGEHSGVALIVVSDDGENQIVINANANQYLCEEDCNQAQSVLDQAKILICQLETPLAATVKALRNFKGTSILNAAPAMCLPEDILTIPSILCVNELEAEGLTGIEIKGIADVADTITHFEKQGCRMAIVTLGKLGAAFNESGKIVHVPLPREVKAIDTCGAGDAFIGALAHFIAKYPQATWIQKIGASVEIASHSVQFKGTQTSFVDFPSIDPTTKNYTFVELS